MGSTMSYRSTSIASVISFVVSAPFSLCNSQPIANDLLQAEQWGLHSQATATCAERPQIDSTTSPAGYSCGSYTSIGITDIDINAPEGWNAYVPAQNLSQQEVVIALIDTGIDYTHPDLIGKLWLNSGEALGVDNNHNGVDDGCEDNIDGDNNGYLNDCHGANTLVERTLQNGSLNPLAGDPIDDVAGHGTNMAGIILGQANNVSTQFHGGI